MNAKLFSKEIKSARNLRVLLFLLNLMYERFLYRCQCSLAHFNVRKMVWQILYNAVHCACILYMVTINTTLDDLNITGEKNIKNAISGVITNE